MSKKVKTLDDLKDSRMLYDKEIPRFGYGIIIVLTFFLGAVTIWSTKAHKTDIVSGSGKFESINKNYIMSAYTGEIEEISIDEGSYVNEGDVLFKIKSTDLNLQGKQLDAQVSSYEKQIEKMDLLEKSIKDNTNYFNSASYDDRAYYNQYESYRSKVEQKNVDVLGLKQYGYTDEQIQEEIRKNQESVNELYYTTLQTIDISIIDLKNQVESLKIQKNSINDGASEYYIKASASGIVHMMGRYKKGMVVQAAGVIGSIANENDEYIVNTSIKVNDRPKIKVGDSADISISGINENVYGTIKGTVKSIDSDISTEESQEGSISYFNVQVVPEKEYVISKDGNMIDISNGMVVETRIRYDEISYFDYILEGLGLLTR